MIDGRLKAAIYVRVSTDKQDANNQLNQLRPFCDRVGYTVVQEYVDVISGSRDSRPAYNQLFKDAHKRKWDVVVFWSLDRFSRSGTLFTLQKLKELEGLRIEWESYQEQYFRTTGPFKDVLISMLATIAKMERDRISERTKAGLARARAEGKVLGRPKGQKDKTPRRRKGYYDNENWRGNGVKKQGETKNG